MYPHWENSPGRLLLRRTWPYGSTFSPLAAFAVIVFPTYGATQVREAEVVGRRGGERVVVEAAVEVHQRRHPLRMVLVVLGQERHAALVLVVQRPGVLELRRLVVLGILGDVLLRAGLHPARHGLQRAVEDGAPLVVAAVGAAASALLAPCPRLAQRAGRGPSGVDQHLERLLRVAVVGLVV